MKQVTVYADPNYYAGWPANHGAWQWGDELLVGFLRGPFDDRMPMHSIAEPFELMQARSLDGGETWMVEPTLIPMSFDHASPAPLFSLSDCIIRVRGNYDHGGDDIAASGGFFLSRDKGAKWEGPYDFGLTLPEGICLTSRTRTMGNFVFMSKTARGTFGCDDTFLCTHDGKLFHRRATICDDDSRSVMPAVARLPSGRIVCALRKRSSQRLYGGWIDSFASDDDGRSWRFLAEITRTGGSNGNPPALIFDGERLVCAYGHRNNKGVYLRYSPDGQNWGLPLRIRSGGVSDIGYPQLFLRGDERIVCVYYWADAETPVQHIAATII